MKIIDRLPFADLPHLVTVRGEAVDVYRNQIIVWISIDDVLRPLPAVLDTGHGHNLSIGEGQLKRWSGASLGTETGTRDGNRDAISIDNNPGDGNRDGNRDAISIDNNPGDGNRDAISIDNNPVRRLLGKLIAPGFHLFTRFMATASHPADRW